MRSAQPGISTQDIANKISDTMFKPCHMTNLSPDLQRSFETASNNLSKDGFCHHLVLCQVGDVSTSANYASDTNVSPNKALELINKFMIKFNQRLYRGNIYQKPKLGKYFYVFFKFLKICIPTGWKINLFFHTIFSYVCIHLLLKYWRIPSYLASQQRIW